MSTSKPNLNDNLQKLLSTITRAVKISQELPSSNTPAYVYYSDFPQYKTITAGQSRKILTISQQILDQLDAKTNILDIQNVRNFREKFSSVIDANDRILERLSVAMDEEEDPGRKTLESSKNEDLVVAFHNTHKASLTWLHPKSKDGLVDNSADNTTKLLSSKHVTRPQISFSKPPDNSSSLFRPSLTFKPNSLRSISASTSEEQRAYEQFDHPYKYELDAFASSLSEWNSLSEDLHPQPICSEFTFVDNVDQLNKMMSNIASCKEIAVDLEHHSFRTYLGFTCLIQLTTRSMDYIVDALALRDHIYRLNEIFTDPTIVKVFHGADCDLMWLQRDFSVYVVNLFDTGLAARALRLARFSLSFLLQRYASVSTNKQYQLADWRIRPLPKELLEYARTDTHYLLYIAARMCRELQDRGLLTGVLERGRQLCLNCYTKPVFNPLGYLDLYHQAAGGGSGFSHRQLYALERLYALRDSIARQEDESIQYVLPNHMLRVIAEVLPREPSGMFACCNPIPPLVRKYVHELHKIVVDARERPLEELPLTRDLHEVTGGTPGEKAEDDNSTATKGAVSTEYSLVTAAPPHDMSRPAASEVMDESCDVVTKYVGHPTPLGWKIGPQNLLASCPQQKSSSHCWYSRLREPNRMLLTKILTLLSIAPVTEVPPDERILNVPAQPATPVVEKKLPAEKVIALHESTPMPKTNRDTQSTPGKPTVSNDTPNSRRNFDPNEVVVLRNEVSKASKRRNRKRACAPEAPVTSADAEEPGSESISETTNCSEVINDQQSLNSSTDTNSSLQQLKPASKKRKKGKPSRAR